MQERVKKVRKTKPDEKAKVTLEIDARLLAGAAAKGIELAPLLEAALASRLKDAARGQLSEADLAAIEAHNRYIAEHGTLADSLRDL